MEENKGFQVRTMKVAVSSCSPASRMWAGSIARSLCDLRFPRISSIFAVFSYNIYLNI